MRSRNAAIAFLLTAMAAAAAPVELTREDNAVIAATLDHRFPDHTRKVLVVDKLEQATWSAPLLVRNGDAAEVELVQATLIRSSGKWRVDDERYERQFPR